MLVGSNSFSQQVSVTLPLGTTTWTPPTGVTSIQVEAWGGGGGGGGSTSSAGRCGGGGAGGSYVKYTNVSVTNTAYNITIGAGGAAGGTSSSSSNGGKGFDTTVTFGTTTITAVGGFGGNGTSLGTNTNNGIATAGNGGPKVTTGNSSGAALSFYGGAGANAVASTRSGGGGGAAGELSDGGDASSSAVTGGLYGGANTSPYGTGANGNNTTNGSPGILPGGGGSGGYTTSTSGKTGGAGAPGQIIISYTPVTPTITLSASSLSGFGSSSNSVSTSQFINVSAVNLTTNITVSASTNFEISTSSTSDFGTSVAIPFGSGTVTATPIYVRVKSGANVGLLSEAITFASASATTQTLTCSGTVVTNYYYKGTGSLATLSNWGTNSDGTGTIPPDFGSATNYQSFIIRNTSSVETDAPFTIGNGTSSVNKLVIGDPTTTAVSLTISLANPITFGTGTKLDITAASSGNNEVIFKNTSATVPALGSIDSSANITYANGSTGVTGTPCNTLKITNNTAVALASTPNCKYLIVDSGSSIVAPSSSFITILSGGNAIINGSISGARSQGIFTTDAANKGTIYGVDLNTPITFGANSTVIYNRSSSQNISPLNYANLTVTINNAQGTLTGSATVNGILSLISGSLTTGANNLTLGNNASAVFGPGTALNITGGTTNFNGRPVTLQSTTIGTARIGTITGTLSGATNVTVERYIPAKRAWRALTSPVNTTNSINANWQEGGTGNGTNGFDIWSNTGGTGIITGGSGSSLLEYNSSTNNWSGITNTTTSSSLLSGSVNKPFMAFVTGAYGTNNITSGAAFTTIRATGALFTGNQTYSSLVDKYTFIGNPYASPINPASMITDTDNAAFGGNIWVWDANASGLNAVGTYNLFNNGTYSNVTSNPVVTSGTEIQSGQAFFVKATAGGTFTIKESHKGTSFSNAVFRNGPLPELLRVGLYKQESNDWLGLDGAMTVILSDADANQSPNKMANGTENIAFTKNGALFASNHLLPLVATDILNIKVWNTTAGANYKLKINTEQFTAANLVATLEDLFTNTNTPLALDGTAVEYPFGVTTNALSSGNRFRIVFQNAVLGIDNPKSNGFSIAPNPVTSDVFQVNLRNFSIGTYSFVIFNALGQEVEQGSISTTSQNTNYEVKMRNSAAGVYIMKIKGSDNKVFTAKIIKK